MGKFGEMGSAPPPAGKQVPRHQGGDEGGAAVEEKVVHSGTLGKQKAPRVGRLGTYSLATLRTWADSSPRLFSRRSLYQSRKLITPNS
ncbi:hypothetical protein D3C76_908370 [compost metagenome]